VGRIVTLSVAVLVTIGGTRVVFFQTAPVFYLTTLFLHATFAEVSAIDVVIPLPVRNSFPAHDAAAQSQSRASDRSASL
jgi:hypothetical protein